MRKCMAVMVMVTVLLAASQAAATIVNKDFHESFDVTEGAVLHLNSGDGDVVITPWDKDVVDVTVRYHAEFKGWKLGGEPDFDVDFSQDGRSIRVTGMETGIGFGIFYTYLRRHEYRYTISAPAYVRLDITGDDGDIRVSAWRSGIDCEVDDGDMYLSDIVADRVRVDMEDGDLRIENLAADLSISADDGDISMLACDVPSCRIRFNDGDLDVTDSSGAFDLAIDDGDVRFDRVAARKLDARGEDGDMDIELRSVEDIDVDVALDDGSIVMTIEPGMSLGFALDCDDGRIEVLLPGAVRLEQGRHWASGEIGGGEGRIRIRTADGSILLREGK